MNKFKKIIHDFADLTHLLGRKISFPSPNLRLESFIRKIVKEQ